MTLPRTAAAVDGCILPPCIARHNGQGNIVATIRTASTYGTWPIRLDCVGGRDRIGCLIGTRGLISLLSSHQRSPSRGTTNFHGATANQYGFSPTTVHADEPPPSNL